jgi:DNA-binding transcriptional regulator YhcF (GntR family)
MAQHPAQVEPNPFATDPGDELPVGLQLTWRLRALIATGQLAKGERLPSFRQLAGWAGVNVNTVRGVYEGLEREGLVVSHQGQGTFVAAEVDSRPELEEIAADALRRAREAGLGPRDLAIVAMACVGVEPESEKIEVRRELRRQIARLEAQLAAHARDLRDDLPTAPRRAVAHLAGVEELEQTRDTLIAQLSEVQRAAEERGRHEAEARGPLGKAMSRWRSKE